LEAEKKAAKVIEDARMNSESIITEARKESLQYVADEKRVIDEKLNEKTKDSIKVIEERQKKVSSDAQKEIDRLEKHASKNMKEAEEFVLKVLQK